MKKLKLMHLILILILFALQGCTGYILENESSYYAEKRLLKSTDRPEEELLIAVRKNPELIKLIPNPSERVQIEAIRNPNDVNYPCYSAIKLIKSPSLIVQLEAVRVKKCPTAITYIHNPSEIVKIEAAKSNPWAILHINSPSKKVLDAAEVTRIREMKHILANPPYPGSYFLHPILRLLTLGGFQEKGQWKEKSETIQLLVVNQHPELITAIINPYPSVKNHPKVLAYKEKQRMTKLKREKEEIEAEERMKEYSSSDYSSSSSNSTSSYIPPPAPICRSVRYTTTVGGHYQVGSRTVCD